MLRIFFTTDDVARTRLAPAPDPLWESVLSLHILGSRQADAAYGDWRHAATDDLRASGVMPHLRTLVALNPPTGYFPDFLTPAAGLDGLSSGLAAIADTPRDMLRRDIATLAEERQLPPDVMELAFGDGRAMRRLADAIRAYYDIALAPIWSRVEAVVEGDRIRRVRAVAGQGTEGLLESLRPSMRWQAGGAQTPEPFHGELQVDYPLQRELHLDGRGLLLLPSYFCWRYPVTLLDPALPPVLVYPAQRADARTGDVETNRVALAALLGGTRAAALAAIGVGCSTTDLARRVGVSTAAASQHATILRNAGLITSQRERNLMMHSITTLGAAVLNGG
jgi:DNA-binding transcriptional ArsR family regulator